jgi:hypothetical protein
LCFWLRYLRCLLSACRFFMALGGEAAILRAGRNPLTSIQKERQRQKKGDAVIFGEFNGHPLVWRVLDLRQSRALIIAGDCVAKMAYNDKSFSVAWDKSALRNWLNVDFYNSAFTKSQRRRIIAAGSSAEKETEAHDSLFLLSIEEANKYFSGDTDRLAAFHGKPTAWWLISLDPEKRSVAVVCSDGRVGEPGHAGVFIGATNKSVGARPALWLTL